MHLVVHTSSLQIQVHTSKNSTKLHAGLLAASLIEAAGLIEHSWYLIQTVTLHSRLHAYSIWMISMSLEKSGNQLAHYM